MIKNKNILITGGTGSLGQSLTKRILEKHNPKSIRIFSRNEKSQVEMSRKFKDNRLRFLIGDVRDRDRLRRAMVDCDIVIHAAAIKHVDVGEYNPIETIKTNVNGAMNVIDAAIDCNVDRVLAISTDKAVYPVNLYGATKMTAEKLFVQANTYSYKKTKFSCVRYGNVLGSSGSVIPLFLKQHEEGCLTITDAEMTRFWIEMERVLDFIIMCITNMSGWEIFVPKMKSMRLIDLADTISPGTKRKIVGIRPGEKLHEVLITDDEARHTIDHTDYYVIEPEFPFHSYKPSQTGKKVDGLNYVSDNNKLWWKKHDIKKIAEDFQ